MRAAAGVWPWCPLLLQRRFPKFLIADAHGTQLHAPVKQGPLEKGSKSEDPKRLAHGILWLGSDFVSRSHPLGLTALTASTSQMVVLGVSCLPILTHDYY